MSIPKSAKKAPSSGVLVFSWQIRDTNLIDNSNSFCSNTYFWQLLLFEFIPYLGVVSQICISDLPWKHQQTTRWCLFSRLWYKHYYHLEYTTRAECNDEFFKTERICCCTYHGKKRKLVLAIFDHDVFFLFVLQT